jgi:hypothetical protein
MHGTKKIGVLDSGMALSFHTIGDRHGDEDRELQQDRDC